MEPFDLATLKAKMEKLEAQGEYSTASGSDVLALHAALVRYRQELVKASEARPTPGTTLEETYQRGRWHAASEALAAFDQAVTL